MKDQLKIHQIQKYQSARDLSVLHKLWWKKMSLELMILLSTFMKVSRNWANLTAWKVNKAKCILFYFLLNCCQQKNNKKTGEMYSILFMCNCSNTNLIHFTISLFSSNWKKQHICFLVQYFTFQNSHSCFVYFDWRARTENDCKELCVKRRPFKLWPVRVSSLSWW